jgi:putative ABC transport system ATP-binding protein
MIASVRVPTACIHEALCDPITPRITARTTTPHERVAPRHDVTMLILRDVGKSYGGVRHRQVLRGVNLEVSRGAFISIMGESGVGKSTLLNLIAGLDLPDNGSITLDGVDLQRLDDTQRTLLRRTRMGFVFQAFHLLPHLTIAQNVRLPLDLGGISRQEANRRTRGILAAVGIETLADDYPRTISGGEAQRAAIARALVHRPALLLADEPTGNLDAENAAQVLALLARQVKEHGTTALLVTHSIAAARTADALYRLSADGLRPELT